MLPSASRAASRSRSVVSWMSPRASRSASRSIAATMLPGLRLIHSRDSVEVRGGSRRTGPRRFRAFAETATSPGTTVFGACPACVADDLGTRRPARGSARQSRHNPVLLFVAAVHDLVLRGLGPDLAALVSEPHARTGYRRCGLGVSFVRHEPCRPRYAMLVATRKTQTNEVGSLLAALLPLLAEVSRWSAVRSGILSKSGRAPGSICCLPHYSYTLPSPADRVGRRVAGRA